ncbi:hypothetical protein INS49_011582 [Diaporthe citri]|uniref:uncharacterized protein n=1 Tax=Diaporthe citri TaxID=83186 RepID=UPI001C7EA63B|nr:uncharacterized protein INS49_011582 [Diaporthe citri]KAG6360520.1 hypothetical protein INS49_011582 [Diaporthe citri]
MDSIVNLILNRSVVTVEHIKITKATPDTLTMSLVNRVTGTGPMGATMSPMIVDMVFNDQPWGKLQLPEVNTKSGGTDVIVQEQEVKITNQESFRAFVKALMLDEELVLVLDNGDCHITAKVMGWPLKSNVTYKKKLTIKGMRGPKLSLVDTTADKNTMKVYNPSPLEIDHALVLRGDFDSTLGITFKPGKKVASGTKLRLVGKGTEKDSWMNDTLKYISSEFEAKDQFSSFLAG